MAVTTTRHFGTLASLKNFAPQMRHFAREAFEALSQVDNWSNETFLASSGPVKL